MELKANSSQLSWSVVLLRALVSPLAAAEQGVVDDGGRRHEFICVATPSPLP
ncbi:hypothetical protein [Streptomyces sp. NPDC049590]|uniref:hypothetical protein n=1 Tax=Streptomyces sp. NPDC049590 TaxID=3154834 RepID=UPI0034161736